MDKIDPKEKNKNVLCLKVRPIIDNLNAASKFHLDSGTYSVDEVMIPYFGRHSSKQFIHGKPIRYGFKVRKNRKKMFLLCNNHRFCLFRIFAGFSKF